MQGIKVNIVDTQDKLCLLIRLLSNKKVLYVDCEGDDLCRYGKIYTIQIYYPNDERLVHIIDLCKLQNPFYIRYGDKTLEDILMQCKLVMFDPRNDVDALYAFYKVLPINVVCLQLAEVAYRKQSYCSVRFLNGLDKCINNYCITSLTREERVIKHKISKQLREGQFNFTKFICNSSNSNPEIVIYSCVDVICMPELELKTFAHLKPPAQQWVEEESKKRCLRAKTFMSFQQIHSKNNALPPPLNFRV